MEQLPWFKDLERKCPAIFWGSGYICEKICPPIQIIPSVISLLAMPESILSLARRYSVLRHTDEAWRLLAAKRAPLILACAEQLFQQVGKSVSLEDAVQLLAKSFEEFRNDTAMDIGEDVYALARQEWRSWLKRGLIVEKNHAVFATDALQKVIAFIKDLAEPAFMTSTASRLETVQAEIEKVFHALNPNQEQRAAAISAQIAVLESELARVQQGDFHILSDEEAEEKIRNIYQLSMSLHNDFRRVEDSYRRMDGELRENIIRSQYHRGEIVTELLDSHAQLINTPEGRVFHSFNQALQREELDVLQENIRTILDYPVAERSLTGKQRGNFYYLTRLLHREADHVVHAKQRIERDVRSFIQTGLAAEHHRVGELLKQIFTAALDINWQASAIRDTPSVLPPLAVDMPKIHALNRLMIKEIKSEELPALDYDFAPTDLADMDMSFWQALDGLDRQAWFSQTLQALHAAATPLTLAELAAVLPPPEDYDMEAIAMWLEMARFCETVSQTTYETLQLTRAENEIWLFHVPLAYLATTHFEQVSLDDI